MITIVRTDSDHADFRNLVSLLDQDLAIRDGEDHAFYSQFNKIDKIRHAVVAYLDEAPVGCGAIKPFDEENAEVKRMFVQPDFRGSGIAGQLLKELEAWAAELGFRYCILETGKKQPEAIRLYTKSQYQVTPNYGQYAGIENSVCMKKEIASPVGSN